MIIHLQSKKQKVEAALTALSRGYSSGHIRSAEQPSLMEKGNGTTLHYIMKKNIAHDLVPPPPSHPYRHTCTAKLFIAHQLSMNIHK